MRRGVIAAAAIGVVLMLAMIDATWRPMAVSRHATEEGSRVDGLRVYRELLGNRPLIRLLVGEFVSGIGDWLYIVAIFVVIY